MDASRFDRLSRALAGASSRRSVARGAATLALAGLLAAPDAEARQRGKGQEIGAEHFRHKKVTYCLNGETIRRYRRKQKKLLAMGATRGKCGDVPPPCVPTTCEALGLVCGSAPDGCGGALQCGECGKGLSCCAGVCTDTNSDDANCGECGNVCLADELCFRGNCASG
jgi:hypothetical protein